MEVDYKPKKSKAYRDSKNRITNFHNTYYKYSNRNIIYGYQVCHVVIPRFNIAQKRIDETKEI